MFSDVEKNYITSCALWAYLWDIFKISTEVFKEIFLKLCRTEYLSQTFLSQLFCYSYCHVRGHNRPTVLLLSCKMDIYLIFNEELVQIHFWLSHNWLMLWNRLDEWTKQGDYKLKFLKRFGPIVLFWGWDLSPWQKITTVSDRFLKFFFLSVISYVSTVLISFNLRCKLCDIQKKLMVTTLHWLCCFFIVFLYFLTSIILTYLTITLEMVFSKRNRIYRVLKNYLQILFCFKTWHDMTGWGRQLVDSSLQWDLACDYIQPEW